MILFLLILVYTLTCLFTVMTILLQAGKGGGLSSLGSGAGGALSDSLGATGAEKTLVKITSWASGIFLALSVILTLYGSRLERTGGLSIGTAPVTQQPSAPAPVPAGAPAPASPATGQPAGAPSAPPGSSGAQPVSAPSGGPVQPAAPVAAPAVPAAQPSAS